MMHHIPWEEITLGPKIGEGGFGVVYRGQWKHGGEVAIKKIKGFLAQDAVEEFKQEAEVMARLNSPYIIRLFGLCWEQQQYAIVMELMPKASLFDLLHNGQPLPWNIRYRIAQDIAYGLRLLHSRNILHRDLKSLNVLLDTNLRAKLTDFGLAKVKTQSKTTSKTGGNSVGTVAWMAPELFGLKPKYSGASDVYAYAMTGWELAAREVPYKDVANYEEIKTEIRAGSREEIPADCPLSFAALIESCWAQDPSQRPNLDAVVASLGRIIQADGMQKPVIANVPLYQDASLSSIGWVTQVSQAAPAPNPVAELKAALEQQKMAFEAQLKAEAAAKQKAEAEAQRAKAELEETRKQMEAEALKVKAEQAKQKAAEVANKKVAILAPRPSVNPQELSQLLSLVAQGEQSKAETMIQKNPDLLLARGTVNDLAGRNFKGVDPEIAKLGRNGVREFKDITALQYSVWALDWHMWKMLLKYLPTEEARLQALEFETGPWVRMNGAHAGPQLQGLIEALRTYSNSYIGWNNTQSKIHWCKQVGGAQLLLPAHVINEYCHPTRSFSFDPPNFEDEAVLPRTRKGKVYANSEWKNSEDVLTAISNSGRLEDPFSFFVHVQGGLGNNFGLIQGGYSGVVCADASGGGSQGLIYTEGHQGLGMDLKYGRYPVSLSVFADHYSIKALCSTRTQQRDRLIIELGNSSTLDNTRRATAGM